MFANCGFNTESAFIPRPAVSEILKIEIPFIIPSLVIPNENEIHLSDDFKVIDAGYDCSDEISNFKDWASDF